MQGVQAMNIFKLLGNDIRKLLRALLPPKRLRDQIERELENLTTDELRKVLQTLQEMFDEEDQTAGGAK
jgi:hypothetical protein